MRFLPIFGFFLGNFDGCVCIACDYGMIENVFYLNSNKIKIDKKFSSKIYYGIGIHPHSAKYFNEKKLREKINKFLELYPNKLVAIGECGLDYFVKPNQRKLFSSKEDQKEVFRIQCQMGLYFI